MSKKEYMVHGEMFVESFLANQDYKAVTLPRKIRLSKPYRTLCPGSTISFSHSTHSLLSNSLECVLKAEEDSTLLPYSCCTAKNKYSRFIVLSLSVSL